MKKYFIYGLVCDNNTFYIGKTKNIRERYLSHLKTAKLKRSYKERHINKLLLESKSISIEIIDEVDFGTEDYWEKYWISKFKEDGVKLYNTSDGGEGGDNWSGRNHKQETKDKLREIRFQKVKEGVICRSIGESNGRSKLNESDVIEIRNLRGSMSYKDLSIKYGVSKTTISDILSRKLWSHI